MGVLLAIIVGLYAFYLGTKITRLENEISFLRRRQGADVNNVASHPDTQSTEAVTPGFSNAQEMYKVRSESNVPNSPATKSTAEESSALEQFVAWLKVDFFVKLGAFLLLIAFGWFVNYAFANDWIGPMGRITLGLVFGVLIMGLGLWRIATHVHQGGIFAALGSTVVLLTVFAAREVYEFFTPGTALLLMFLSVLFVAFLSVRFRSEPLALASLVLAGIAPFLTNPPEPSAMMLFSYLMAVVLGTLWVVYLTSSNTLTFAALVLSFGYSVPFLLGAGEKIEQSTGLMFAFVFTIIFFAANVVSIVRVQAANARKGQVATAFFTGLFLVTWVAVAVPAEWQSLLYIAWMLVFTAGAFVVYAYTSYRVPFYVYNGVAIALLAAATATELDGALLTTVYSIEAASLVLIARTLLKNVAVAKNLCWLFVGPVLLSFEHTRTYQWNDGFMHEHFFALLVLASSLLVAGGSLISANTKQRENPSAAIILVAGSVYGLLLVWLVTHSVMSDDAATTLSLVVYTVLGLILFIKGRTSNRKAILTAGGILLGFVVLRLLLIDVWQMELFGRVVTFAAIGVLLVSTAFIKKPETSSRENTQ